MLRAIEVTSKKLRAIMADALGRLIVGHAAPIELRTVFGAVNAGVRVYSDVLDLGDASVRQHTLILLYKKSNVASSGEILQLDWSDNAVTWKGPLPSAFDGKSNAFVNYSNQNISIQGRPMGRYVRANYLCGSVALSSLSLNLTALAGA